MQNAAFTNEQTLYKTSNDNSCNHEIPRVTVSNLNSKMLYETKFHPHQTIKLSIKKFLKYQLHNNYLLGKLTELNMGALKNIQLAKVKQQTVLEEQTLTVTNDTAEGS